MITSSSSSNTCRVTTAEEGDAGDAEKEEDAEKEDAGDGEEEDAEKEDAGAGGMGEGEKVWTGVECKVMWRVAAVRCALRCVALRCAVWCTQTVQGALLHSWIELLSLTSLLPAPRRTKPHTTAVMRGAPTWTEYFLLRHSAVVCETCMHIVIT